MTQAPSLRNRLLLAILGPLAILLALAALLNYRQNLNSINTAYDRNLLSSAKAIGEQLIAKGDGAGARVIANLPVAALEPFESDNQGRIYYRITDFRGELVSGFSDLPEPKLAKDDHQTSQVYSALVRFYDADYQGEPVRIAELLQPVATTTAHGMAKIYVAETLELRRRLARRSLTDTALIFLGSVVLAAAAVFWSVNRATEPLRRLGRQVTERDYDDLKPLPETESPKEAIPLIQATNQMMQRVADLVGHQKRFVRDAAHQLRTPLAVLKTQVQTTQRETQLHSPLQVRLSEIESTVDRATELANQMLNLAKVEQLRVEPVTEPVLWGQIIRDVALDVAPLIADKHIVFSIETQSVEILAHRWMLQEMARNLLHNAIKACHRGGEIRVSLVENNGQATLSVTNHGAPLKSSFRAGTFAPFAAEHSSGGFGLGLAICAEVAKAIKGDLSLANSEEFGFVVAKVTTQLRYQS